MISRARPLPIEVVGDDAPVPQECIEIVASLLLDAVDAEDTASRAGSDMEVGQ